MTEAKHTPGPWRVRELDAFTGKTEIVSASGPVAKAYRNNNTAQAEANARLIAAAPDMLEALKALVRDSMASDFNEHWQSFKDAEAAISKATGAQ